MVRVDPNSNEMLLCLCRNVGQDGGKAAGKKREREERKERKRPKEMDDGEEDGEKWEVVTRGIPQSSVSCLLSYQGVIK